MSRISNFVFSLGLLATAGAYAQTTDIVRSAILNGAEEVPPVTTSGSGESQVTIRRTETAIEYTLNVTGLVDITAAHIHIGEPGVAGPIIFPLTTPNVTTPVSGRLTQQEFTPQPAQGITTFEDALRAIEEGRTYVNVHTTAYPNGEIRGQLIDVQAGQSPTPGTTATPTSTESPGTSRPATTVPQSPY